MDMHRLIGLFPRFLINEARSLTFDLHARPCFLLNVLDEHALQMSREKQSPPKLLRTYSRADDFGAHVEIANRLQSNEDFLFGPFTLGGG